MRKFSCLIATLTLCSASFAAVAPPPAVASAGTTIDNDHWSGVVGKPSAIGAAPVTHVEMHFIVPELLCTKATSEVAIWVGLDSAGLTDAQTNRPDLYLTQAGLLGVCDKGNPSWAAFYEANVNTVPMLPIPELSQLHTGEGVYITLDYRPDIASDAFVADFTVDDWPTSLATTRVAKTFYSPSGATQRQRADCIVERPLLNRKQWAVLADFKAAPAPAGTPGYTPDFAVNCLGGNAQYNTFLAGPASNQVWINMVSRYSRHNHPLVRTSALAPNPSDPLIAYVSYHWLAAK